MKNNIFEPKTDKELVDLRNKMILILKQYSIRPDAVYVRPFENKYIIVDMQYKTYVQYVYVRSNYQTEITDLPKIAPILITKKGNEYFFTGNETVWIDKLILL